MKNILYLVIFILLSPVCLSLNNEEMDVFAKSIARKAYIIDDLISSINSYCSHDVTCIDTCLNEKIMDIKKVLKSEYIVGARYDSISVTVGSDYHRLYFLYLVCIKHDDSTQSNILGNPDRYCTVSSSGKYYILDTKRQYDELKESFQPIDNPQKAEFLAIVYSKCLKGVSHYKPNDPNSSISTVFKNDEYITTISEKVYDSYWNDLIKHEKVFRITPKGVYSMDETEVEKK